MHARTLIALLGAMSALIVAGCGGDGDDGQSSSTTSSTTTATEGASGVSGFNTPGPQGDELDAAGINLVTGSDNGVAPDTRHGAKPPPGDSPGELEAAAKAANCELRLDLPDEGNTHIAPGDTPPKYKTNPPTSGDHILPPLQQADGAYAEYPAPVATVHSMEHGRVLIQYSPKLPEGDQLLLKGLFDELPGGMLLFPNQYMPYEIAATAWTQLMGCKRWEGAPTIAALRAFRDEFRGEGPEDVPVDF